MSDELVLRITDLREAIDTVLRAAERQFGAEVVLPGDHYWHLPVDAAFDMNRRAGRANDWPTSRRPRGAVRRHRA